MANDPVQELPSLDVVIAQLRHAYLQAFHSRIRNQRQFADGLLAPCIRRLEEFKDRVDRIVHTAEQP